jgi:hypothetical protein
VDLVPAAPVPGLFVAFGAGLPVSDDGKSWQPVALPAPATSWPFSSVHAGSGRFVAFGAGVWNSEDGRGYERVYPAAGAPAPGIGVQVDAGAYWLAEVRGGAAAAPGSWIISTDGGRSWSAHGPTPAFRFTTLAANGDILLAEGRTGATTAPELWRSGDRGLTWRPVELDRKYRPPQLHGFVVGRFVVTAEGGEWLEGEDGLSWRSKNLIAVGLLARDNGTHGGVNSREVGSTSRRCEALDHSSRATAYPSFS